MQREQETKRALIVVRTYPSPAKNGVEVSCTAAITDKGEWLRLFPVPYRFLDQDKRFRKYQWVEVGVTKARDHRPESFKLREDSIKILTDPLPTSSEWQARKEIIFPLKAHSLCGLQRERAENGHPTLGIFRPKAIEKLIIKAETPSWTDYQQALLRQGHLWQRAPTHELEKVPFSFRYQFHCEEDGCTGHTMICTDWEIGEAWRRWSKDYGSDWEAKFRQRFETEMIEKYDTHFYVGTVHKHPGTWIIVGLFYPPKPQASATLFG
jgi:hypothetical protein